MNHDQEMRKFGRYKGIACLVAVGKIASYCWKTGNSIDFAVCLAVRGYLLEKNCCLNCVKFVCSSHYTLWTSKFTPLLSGTLNVFDLKSFFKSTEVRKLVYIIPHRRITVRIIYVWLELSDDDRHAKFANVKNYFQLLQT